MSKKKEGEPVSSDEDDISSLFSKMGGGTLGYHDFAYNELPQRKHDSEPTVQGAGEPEGDAPLRKLRATEPAPLREEPVIAEATPLARMFERLLAAEAPRTDGPLKRLFPR